MADQPSPEQRTQLGAVGAASGLGCSIVVTLVVLIGGGVLLDKAIGTSPVFTLIGVVVGLIAAGYQLYELAQIGRSDRAPGPLARRLLHHDHPGPPGNGHVTGVRRTTTRAGSPGTVADEADEE